MLTNLVGGGRLSWMSMSWFLILKLLEIEAGQMVILQVDIFRNCSNLDLWLLFSFHDSRLIRGVEVLKLTNCNSDYTFA